MSHLLSKKMTVCCVRVFFVRFSFMSVKQLCEGPVSETVLNCYVQIMK